MFPNTTSIFAYDAPQCVFFLLLNNTTSDQIFTFILIQKHYSKPKIVGSNTGNQNKKLHWVDDVNLPTHSYSRLHSQLPS